MKRTTQYLTGALILMMLALFAAPHVSGQQGGTTRYLYDLNGRLQAVIAPNGDVAFYEYDAAGNLQRIRRSQSGPGAVVAISGFTPERGQVGDTVTINGTGFSAMATENRVWFLEGEATVISASTTQLVVTVPEGAISGRILVVAPAGVAVSQNEFILPSFITDFTPVIGKAGTEVFISGRNFLEYPAENQIYFHQTSAVISKATTRSLTTLVPAGATSGKIRVTNQYGTSATTTDFFIPPDPYLAADVGYTGRMQIDGEFTMSIPQPARIGLVTFDGVVGQTIGMLAEITTQSGLPRDSDERRLTIYNPDGSPLVLPIGMRNNLMFKNVTLPMTGTYLIVVGPNPSGLARNFKLKLYSHREVNRTLAADGSRVSLDIYPGQTGRLTFAGTTGQRVSLLIVCGNAGRVSIFKPDGARLMGPLRNSDLFYAMALTLPETGTYSIVNEPVNQEGEYLAVRLFTLPPDIAGTITPDGPPVNLTLPVPGQKAQLTFTGTAGQKVSLAGTSSSPATMSLSILQPDGTVVGGAPVMGTVFYLNPVTLPGDGQYIVQVVQYTEPDESRPLPTLQLKLYNITDLSGTLTPDGPPVTLELTKPGQKANLTFSAVAGKEYDLRLSQVTIPALELFVLAPGGTQQIAYGTVGADGQTFHLNNLENGTYSILVSPILVNTGNVTLALTEVRSDVPVIPIIAGGPTVEVNFTAQGESAILRFNGQAGQRVSTRIATPTALYTTFTMTAPGGDVLVDHDVLQFGYDGYNDGTGKDFVDTVTLPETGVYSILLEFTSYIPGVERVTLFNVPPDVTGTILPGGAPVTVTTTVPGQNGQLTFNAVAGQRISLEEFPDQPGPDFLTFAARVFSPSNEEIYSLNSPLMQSGTHRIMIDPYGDNIGSFSVKLNDIPEAADVTGQITIGGPAVTLTTTTPGQNVRLTFTAVAGQKISIVRSVNPTELFSTLFLIGPDGTYLVNGNTGSYIDTLQLPTTGTWTILVDPYFNDVGSFTTRLYDASEVIGATASDGVQRQFVIPSPGQNLRLSFSGNAGERISIDSFAFPLLDSSRLSIINPDGTLLTSTQVFGSSPYFVNPVTLPVSGTYTLLIDLPGSTTSTISLKMYNVPPDISGTVTVGGAGLPITIGTPGQVARVTFAGTAGQVINLELSSVSISEGIFIVYGPDGTELLGRPRWNGMNYVDSLFPAGGVVSNFSLPVTGTYTVLIDPKEAATGNATFRVILP